MLNENIFGGEIIERRKTDSICVLPIYFPPPVVSYLHYANQLAVQLTNLHLHSRFFVYYLQLYWNEPEVLNNLLRYYPDYNSYGLQTFNSIHEVSKIFHDTIIDRIIYFIDNGYYMDLYLPEHLIPGMQLHEQPPAMHNSFFYGYDKQHKFFKVLNFNKSKNYTMIDLSFNDLMNVFKPAHIYSAIDNTSWFKKLVGGYFNFFHLYRLDPNQNRREIDSTYYIKQYLQDYMNSRNTSLNCFLKDDYEDNAAWGLEIYVPLINYIKSLENGEFEFGCLHSLYDHKKVMLMRLLYLEQIGALKKKNPAYSEIFKPVVKKAQFFWMCCLKYFSKKDEDTKKQIINIIHEIRDQESPIYESILKEF